MVLPRPQQSRHQPSSTGRTSMLAWAAKQLRTAQHYGYAKRRGDNMCGISALWGNPNSDLIRAMMDSFDHRGPDGNGLLVHQKATLGHQRLAIMDPTGGIQPMKNEDGSLAIIANGEIYNFADLKQQLEHNHQFSTTSDSEAALHLYEEHGPAMAEQLDGMFAFVISDGQALFAARDVLGIKPLYYGHVDDSIVFASELKALAGRATDVKEFPAGYSYHSQHGFRQFRPIPRDNPANHNHTPKEWMAIIRTTLERATVKRLMSDVPVGAFVSGGLDSSVLAAIARLHLDELHTFAIGTEGSPDLLAARKVAAHIDSIHHEFILSPDLIVQHLPTILYYLESFDQDLVRSAIPNYFVAQLASQHVKVILTGEGADELFAGYDYMKAYYESDSLHDELYRAVTTLHNINLQRVDRMTMAHSIEGRVPFLDLDMIRLGQQVPAALKIHADENGQLVEKWILRKAVEDLLPPEIVWRRKEEFGTGSGAAARTSRLTAHFMSDAEADSYIAAQDVYLRSREEAVYHKLLSEAYADPTAIMTNVARWINNRLDQ